MILTYLFLLLSTLNFQQESNSWHGIVPLRSTRADVERLLGPPLPESKAPYAASYRTKSERVFVLYSTGPCDINPSHGWNVPAGTVIEISVEPNVKPKLADLKFSENKYKRIPDPELLDLTSYTNDDDGISITVNTKEGLVTAYSYSPMSKEKYLLCPTPTDHSTEILGIVPHKIDEYSNLPLVSERKRLDKLVKLMLTYPTTDGYIIAYSGKPGYDGEAQRIAKRAKAYLVSRGISAGRIKTIDGGYSETWTVELFIVPVGATPPSEKVTVDPSEAQNLRNRKVRNNRHSFRLRCNYGGN